MKTIPTWFRSLFVVVFWSPLAASAVQVTDNNLTVTSLGGLTNTTTIQVSVPFTAPAWELFGVRAAVTGLQFGATLNPYHVDGLSTNAITKVATSFVTTSRNFSPAPTSYSQTHTLLRVNRDETGFFYNLGIARDDVNAGGATYNYRFATPDVVLYTASGADSGLLSAYGGNLVPNASFEDSAINFFTGGTSLATNAVHGTQAMHITGNTARYITLPVIPNTSYALSFWYRTGGDAQAEYGFAPPANGNTVAAGNTTPGGSAGLWKEVQFFFVPTTLQTNLFIGGSSNTGAPGGAASNYLQFDSLYLAILIPEPSVGIFCLLGLAWLSRRVWLRNR